LLKRLNHVNGQINLVFDSVVGTFEACLWKLNFPWSNGNDNDIYVFRKRSKSAGGWGRKIILEKLQLSLMKRKNVLCAVRWLTNYEHHSTATTRDASANLGMTVAASLFINEDAFFCYVYLVQVQHCHILQLAVLNMGSNISARRVKKFKHCQPSSRSNIKANTPHQSISR
jgi:hypothetical protein